MKQWLPNRLEVSPSPVPISALVTSSIAQSHEVQQGQAGFGMPQNAESGGTAGTLLDL